MYLIPKKYLQIVQIVSVILKMGISDNMEQSTRF